MGSETDREVIFVTEGTSVYHFKDDDGNPLCNARNFGEGPANIEYGTESEVGGRRLCGKCEPYRNGTRRPNELANEIREVVGLEPSDEYRPHLAIEEKQRILEVLQGADGDE